MVSKDDEKPNYVNFHCSSNTVMWASKFQRPEGGNDTCVIIKSSRVDKNGKQLEHIMMYLNSFFFSFFFFFLFLFN